MNNKLIQLLTLTALLISASAHAMENHEELGEQLRRAADTGNLALVQQLLQQGAPIDATYAFDRTPLMHAAMSGHTDTCQLLIERGASVDAKGVYGSTPLMSAAYWGHTDTCQLLLNNKASVDATDDTSATPLVIAAYRGHTDICQLLLNNKASVDAKNIVGSTPLMQAAYRGHTNTCHLLIDTIVTQIKNSKAMAIALLGLKNRGKISCLNPIDKNVIRLIARKVVYDSAPSRKKQQESLFAQLNAIENNKLKQELLAYAREKLNAKSNSNQGNSDE